MAVVELSPDAQLDRISPCSPSSVKLLLMDRRYFVQRRHDRRRHDGITDIAERDQQDAARGLWRSCRGVSKHRFHLVAGS